MYQIHRIKAFNDNYIWLISQNNYCAVIDPGDAQPVIEFIKDNKLTLTDILLTHHHSDHTGGVEQLIRHFPDISIYGPDTARFTMVNKPCREHQSVELEKVGMNLNVMELPGHTIDHIAFYNDQVAFVGDTLFSCGCGRLFEGTAQQMFQSLTKLSELNKDTQIYCAHEYTESNVNFALSVDPSNSALFDYAKFVSEHRVKGLPTIPVTLENELQVNPFLRWADINIKSSTAKKFNVSEPLSDEQTFALLRKWKDNF